MIDIKNGEQIFVEKEGGRKYRLGSNGGKKYEDEKPKKQCDLPATSPPPPRPFPPPPPRHLPATSPPLSSATSPPPPCHLPAHLLAAAG